MELGDGQVRELVRRFAAVGKEGWGDAVLEGLGWRVPEYSEEELERRRAHPQLAREEYDTGVGTDRGIFARYGAGDERTCVSVRVGKGDGLFRRLRAALVEEVGAPSVMRGPGPLLRWRSAVRLLELERTGHGVYLAARPAEAVESAEYRIAKWGEAEDGLAELGYWQITGRGPENGDLFVPGGYTADGWEEFAKRLETTLGSVLRDFAVLGGPGDFIVVVRAPGRRFVQWCAEGPGLQIDAPIPEGAGPEWSAAMDALGWRPPDPEYVPELMIREFSALEADTAATAARMLVGALRSYGVEYKDLWHEVISPNIDLLGIGIPTSHGGW